MNQCGPPACGKLFFVDFFFRSLKCRLGTLIPQMDLFEKAWPFAESRDDVFTQKAAANKNRLRILGLIARRRCLSQRQLVLNTGLQASTVSNIVRAFKEQGILRDGAAIEAERAGPKETELELVPESVWCAGVALDALGHRLALVNACGHMLAQETLPPGLPADQIVACLAERIPACAARAGLDPARLGGVGISVPGVVDSESGTVLISRSLNLHGFPLREPLERALGCPVWVERNVACGAYAEHHTGISRHRDSFIYFLLRTDPDHPVTFGLSLVIGEKIFQGCNSAAGEVDYNLLTPALTALKSSRRQTPDGADAFYAAFANTLTGIVNLLDISCVVLSSNDDALTNERFDRLSETIAGNLIPVPRRRFDLLRSSMGIDGIIVGSAQLALHRGLAARLNQPRPDSPARTRATSRPRRAAKS